MAESPTWDDMILVGRVARPHGIRGQVIVTPETDFVEERFREGATLWCRSARGDERLTVETMRVQKGRPIVGFEGFERIEDVERLSGVELRIPEVALQPLSDGSYYHHDLVGCVVRTVADAPVGTVVRVEGGTGGSLLVIEGTRGEVLIPLVAEICVEIDVRSKRIRIDPPDGLLDLNV
ncbi:MAG TPA: ribosome maturation factor RimM [Vicinamibacterales bacterium]|nr:ribosome maturation factor RimM [Vicinamibacterales bacterium]